MPYVLYKKPRHNLWWVKNAETGEKFSHEALPRDKAEAQLKALYAAEERAARPKMPKKARYPAGSPEAHAAMQRIRDLKIKKREALLAAKPESESKPTEE